MPCRFLVSGKGAIILPEMRGTIRSCKCGEGYPAKASRNKSSTVIMPKLSFSVGYLELWRVPIHFLLRKAPWIQLDNSLFESPSRLAITCILERQKERHVVGQQGWTAGPSSGLELHKSSAVLFKCRMSLNWHLIEHYKQCHQYNHVAND